MDEPFVEEWAKKIKALKCGADDQPYYGKYSKDYFTTAFAWEMKPEKLADDLEEVAKIWTLHRWAYYGFFKPSIGEVIMQIPKDMLDKVDAFMVIGPSSAQDLNVTSEYTFKKSVHVAQTILYAKKSK